MALVVCAATVACAGNRIEISSALGREVAAATSKAILSKQLCGGRSDAACAERVNLVWSDVKTFYESRGGEPVWVNGKEPASASTIAIAALGRASEHGLNPERYGMSALKTEADSLRAHPKDKTLDLADRLAGFETRLTTALLALGRDVAIGKPGPPPTGVGDRHRQSPDIAARLASVLDEGDLTAWPDDVRPVHPQYAALEAALAKVDPAQADAGKAVRLLALNLERWRWIPDSLGSRYLIVNIPSFHFYVYEGDRPVVDSKVIVGRIGDETPVFSADMTNVVFSPYWNIPESIAEGETLPSIVRNPAYLAKNNIEVLRRSGGSVERVDPSTVDWSNSSETSEISLRQKPGPGNALGHIKFLLPNRNNVYLHDTPTHNLFSRNGRAFSHGCVRVEEPLELAKYVLADEPKWTEEAIRKAMDAGEEQSVKLKRTLPVHIVYFTAWADPSGNVTFLNDVYGRDK